MFHINVINPLIKDVSANPDKTAARVGDSIISNSQFFQLVAPIMNELDAMSAERIALPLRPDISICAAILAAFLTKTTVITLDPSYSKADTAKILDALNTTTILTPERMHYYYRMTFEDALAKIDNGLYDIEDDRVLWIDCSFDGQGSITQNIIKAGDFKFKKDLTIPVFFHDLLSNYPELCSIF